MNEWMKVWVKGKEIENVKLAEKGNEESIK